MRVSVIIPAWGKTPFLGRAMDSVRRASSTRDEIIVCAPPTDGPQTALAARLSGVCRARGEWVLFVDADDWIESDLIERLLSSIHADVDSVCSGLIRGRCIRLPSADIWADGPSDVFNCLCAKLFRKSLFDGLTLDSSVAYGEDLLATACLLHRARRIVSIQTARYHYCENSNSVTHTLDGYRRVCDLMRVGRLLRTELSEPCFTEFHDRLTRDAMLLWCRYRLMDRTLWRELRAQLSTPLLADARHGWLKKGVLFGASCLFD